MERQDIIPNNNSRLLRTILKEEVYEELQEYAKQLSTGRGDWDFGVAISRLLQTKDFHIKCAELESRIESLEMALFNMKQEEKVDIEDINPHGLIGKHR